MMRSSVRWPLVSLMLLAMTLVAATASAAPSKSKKKGKKAKEEKTPVSAEIAKSMGDLKWGTSREEMQKYLIDKVKEHYKPLIAKTRDAVEEDRLREKANNEIKAIRDSNVEFKGTTTGWDVSFLKGEFTHGNGESMLVSRDQNSQNFYFFMGDKLWKWYKAFDAEVFPAGNFASFASAVQRRFGPAKDARGEIAPGMGERHWLEWQDDKTRARAVDQSDFYGFYSLVFEQKSTVANLASLRKNTRDTGNKQHAMIEAVTSGGTEANEGAGSDIADRITGKNRAQPQAQATAQNSKGKKAAEPAAPTGVTKDDDPLSGLGL